MSKWEQTRAAEGGPDNQDNSDAVAKRAYELFLQRGSTPGNEIDDWLQAEAELRSRAEQGDREAQTAADAGADGARDLPRTPANETADRRPGTADDGRGSSRERGGGRRGTRQQANH
jgi:hypothetical protein